MGKNLSLKLAVNNIKNNRKFYLPYFLASVGIIAMFYIICFLAVSHEVQVLSASLSMIMYFGAVVMGIFAFIFLFYTNSFLMKRRKKEIGIYNILGMEKRHIARILAIENLLISVSSMVLGLMSGVLFSKLIHLGASWVFGGEPPFGIHVEVPAVFITLVLFGILFTLTTFFNQMSIHLAKPIELLYGGNMGEKEPKTRWILACLGALCLGGGYGIANLVDSPLTAIFYFFIAVVLVIIGTYCLFTAGSVAILKALRRNRKFYYKPANFTAVSGLIYRMKQNAVGLANICILSTMVLVMVSGTVCLFAGMDDVIDGMVPKDIRVTAHCYEEDEQVDREKARSEIKRLADEKNIEIESLEDYQVLEFVAMGQDDGHFTIEHGTSLDLGGGFIIVTEAQYEAMTGKDLQLKGNEVAEFSPGRSFDENFSIEDLSLTVKTQIDRFMSSPEMDGYLKDIHYLVVADEEMLFRIFNLQQGKYGVSASPITYYFDAALSEDDAESEAALYDVLMEELGQGDLGYYGMLTVESKSQLGDNFYDLVGGFLFLGLFLGVVFTFAAALIIYYKQISEGYYDREKFEIMQKVGMSKTEVKQVIRKQVLMVFFAPLVMAGLHIVAAFHLIKQLLLVFAMTNATLFAVCTLVTFLVFAGVYTLVYAVTAREYYKIVG